jgi:hypothetical protein
MCVVFFILLPPPLSSPLTPSMHPDFYTSSHTKNTHTYPHPSPSSLSVCPSSLVRWQALSRPCLPKFLLSTSIYTYTYIYIRT